MPDAFAQAAERTERERDANRRTLTMVRWLLYLIFVVIGWLILHRLAPILTPVLAAAGIAYLLDPLAERLVARGMNRVTAAALLLVAFLTIVTTAVAILVPLVADDVARFITELPNIIDRTAAWTADQLGYQLDPGAWRDLISQAELTSLLREAAMPILSTAAAVAGGVFTFLGHMAELLLIPVFAFYFLLDWRGMLSRIRKVIPQRHRGQVTDIATEIDGVVSSWIRGQLTVTTILAVLYAIAFKAIGLHLAITMGLIVGVLTIIPFVGTIVGAGITALIILADWHGPRQLAMAGGVFVVLHLLEAGFLTPRIVGHRVGLSEVGALFAVVAGGKLLGFSGVFLAVPLAASIAVLVRRALHYYEETAFFTEGAEEAWIEHAPDDIGGPLTSADSDSPPETDSDVAESSAPPEPAASPDDSEGDEP